MSLVMEIHGVPLNVNGEQGVARAAVHPEKAKAGVETLETA
jgi:hypothetical protein